MKPDKALELVLKYGRLTRLIKHLGTQIGEGIEACDGVKGGRQARINEDVFLPSNDWLDDKGRDKTTHLWRWLNEPVGYHSDGEPIYEGIDDAHKAICPHCHAAWHAVQERRQARKDLGYVKGAMTRASK